MGQIQGQCRASPEQEGIDTEERETIRFETPTDDGFVDESLQVIGPLNHQGGATFYQAHLPRTREGEGNLHLDRPAVEYRSVPSTGRSTVSAMTAAAGSHAIMTIGIALPTWATRPVPSVLRGRACTMRTGRSPWWRTRPVTPSVGGGEALLQDRC